MKVLYTKNIYTIYLLYNIHTKNTLINNDELLFFKEIPENKMPATKK